MEQKKYYVEIYDITSQDTANYVVQSKYFTSEAEAMLWANAIDFIKQNYKMRLMYATFDEEFCVQDIFIEENLL